MLMLMLMLMLGAELFIPASSCCLRIIPFRINKFESVPHLFVVHIFSSRSNALRYYSIDILVDIRDSLICCTVLIAVIRTHICALAGLHAIGREELLCYAAVLCRAYSYR